MKKILLVSLLLFPVFSWAACYCDEDIEEESGEFVPYEYLGFKYGESRPLSMFGGQNAVSSGVTYGKRSSDLFGYELEYATFGSFSVKPDTYLAEHFGVSGVHYLSFPESNFSLYGKTGLSFAQTSGTQPRSESLFAVIGVGIDYKLNRQYGMRFSYDLTRISTPEKTPNNFSAVTLYYKFQ